jgi:protocatechuate 3,4-dioxygenase beta subunit
MTHADHADHADDADDPFDRGLTHDVTTLVVQRRRALHLLSGAGLAAIAVACSSDGDATNGSSGGTMTTADPTTSTTGSTAATTSTAASASTAATTAAAGTAGSDASASCSTIPEETSGPFPGDGSNGPNVLSESGVVRSDIRSSLGDPSTVADGVPLTIALTLTDTAAGCTPFAGAAVYLWHCDREGRYSMYSSGVEDVSYLRGVQEVGADGTVSFTTIVPGCYSGRWPHAHFEVYETLAAATAGENAIATSQLALPQAMCEAAYASDGYESSVGNLARVSIDGDNVFGDDGAARQLPTVTGDVDAGYTTTLAVGV